MPHIDLSVQELNELEQVIKKHLSESRKLAEKYPTLAEKLLQGTDTIEPLLQRLLMLPRLGQGRINPTAKATLVSASERAKTNRVSSWIR